MEWKDGIKHELYFWDSWYASHGLHWRDDYSFRIDPDAEIQKHISIHLSGADVQILDVGAGPLTVLGKRLNGFPLQIRACDALADYYRMINRKYRIIPLVETEICPAEDLVQKYGFGSFGLVHAQNCIDHCADPLLSILSMFCVVSVGGKVIMTHEVNEGENEGYSGFHQWNFYEHNGEFMISGKGNTYNVTQLFGSTASVVTTSEDGYIFNVITKICEVPELDYFGFKALDHGE